MFSIFAYPVRQKIRRGLEFSFREAESSRGILSFSDRQTGNVMLVSTWVVVNSYMLPVQEAS
jgi:hypothetical protein